MLRTRATTSAAGYIPRLQQQPQQATQGYVRTKTERVGGNENIYVDTDFCLDATANVTNHVRNKECRILQTIRKVAYGFVSRDVGAV